MTSPYKQCFVPSSRVIDVPDRNCKPDAEALPLTVALDCTDELAYSRLEEFNARLLESDSATRTLENWCVEGGENICATVNVLRLAGAWEPPTPEIRSLLAISDEQMCRYRRVKLVRGNVVLSEAENWYIPDALTDEMNFDLEQSDTSFGRVVQPLGFVRRTLSAEVLWRPSTCPPRPVGSPPVEGSAGGVADHVLRHRALLLKPDARPFSFVVETYTRHVLQYPK